MTSSAASPARFGRNAPISSAKRRRRVALDRPLKAQEIVEAVVEPGERQGVGARRKVDRLHVRLDVRSRGEHYPLVERRHGEVVHLVVVPIAVREDGHLRADLQAERAQRLVLVAARRHPELGHRLADSSTVREERLVLDSE
jgi:hypothetical protein